jgi:hypothetical protein
MTELLRPTRGGFLRPFGCGWFIREFLMGNGPYGSPGIDPAVGAPQSDIFHYYKISLMRVTALDRATKAEERLARHEKRLVSPDNIEMLTESYLSRLSYKGRGCRYHSFVVYFSDLVRLGWVETTGEEEPSAFQEHYPEGQPRRYYRLTEAGITAGDTAWTNPHVTLYGSRLG